MRAHTKCFLLAALACLSACGRSAPLPSPIVVITIDTLRADRLGCYGYGRDTSPNIDAFAAQALLFENASTTITTTLPAHVSLWTSQYPLQTGIVTNELRFRSHASDSTRFFAQMLAEQGYATAAFVSATPVKKESGIGVGFELFDQPQAAQRNAWETTTEVIRWLDSRAEGPLFLWIHYFDPHQPYEPPPPFHEAFETDEILVDFLAERGLPSPQNEFILDANNRYDGEILFVDRQIQRLFGALRERGLFEPATIVLTSDHGEGLGQHKHMGHGWIYNEHTGIPLIIKFPGDSPWHGERRSNLVSIVDVLPTLVEALDLPVDERSFEGVDALGEDPRDAVFAQRSFAEREGRSGKGPKYAMRTERWKLHNSKRGYELYEMHGDVHELRNRARIQKDVADGLYAELMRLVRRHSAGGEGLELLEELAPETLEELRKLGYVED
jgi:arylsulfatase A-like enzyme